MTPEQFCYWLRGRVELLPEQVPSAEEWAVIREHLATTYKKEVSPLDQFGRTHGPAEKFGPAPSYIQPPPMFLTSPIPPDAPVC